MTNATYFFEEESWANGPDLPEAVLYPGLARLSGTEVLLFGGFVAGVATKKSRIFNHGTGAFTSTGDLPVSSHNGYATGEYLGKIANLPYHSGWMQVEKQCI